MGFGFLKRWGGGESLTPTETTEYELLADIEVTGSATTNVYINGLNIGKGDEVVLVSLIDNTSASTSFYQLFCNNNITGTNYYRQYLVADSTTILGARENNSYITGLAANSKSITLSKIKLTNNGYFVSQSQSIENIALNSVSLADKYCTSTWTTSAITSLQITSSVASAIGIGSRFQLYKATGEVTQTWVTT